MNRKGVYSLLFDMQIDGKVEGESIVMSEVRGFFWGKSKGAKNSNLDGNKKKRRKVKFPIQVEFLYASEVIWGNKGCKGRKSFCTKLKKNHSSPYFS
jgi:hypothetical protein